MKKIGLISALFLGVASFMAFGLGTKQAMYAVHADPEDTETEESTEETTETETEETTDSTEETEPVEVFECSVVIAEYTHGKVSVSKTEGHVGELIEVNADAELFYLVKSIDVNGTALIESEEITGLYTFALVEGENLLTVKFVIDEELLGAFSTMVQQASNKDWTNLFSLKNVVTIITFLLNGGLLIAMVRYFIKDKRIAKNVEKSVEKTMKTVVPEATANAVTATVNEAVAPIFSQILAHQEELEKAMSVFAKCMALGQENTPEARRAILDELSGLKIGDINAIEEARKYIENLIKSHQEEIEAMLNKVKEIIAANTPETEQLPEPETETETEPGDNGTQI